MAISGATILETPTGFRRYQCADGVAISKGDLLVLIDANTASGASLVGEAFAGIASADKVANDGSTNIGCYTDVIADLQLTSSGVAVGSLLMLSGANLLIPATANAILSGAVVGKALETGSAQEKIRVAVGRSI
jgi:hypothetical protein